MIADGGLGRRLSEIRLRIKSAAERAGRDPGGIALVAVSKRQPVEKMRQLQQLYGPEPVVFGESYVQEFKGKKDRLVPPFASHLIGVLQRNKAKDAVRLFDVIQSVHSEEIAQALDHEAGKNGKVQRIFIQVNISQDQAKSGFFPDAAREFVCQQLGKLTSLSCQGLMTITRLYAEAEHARDDFRALKDLASSIEECAPVGLGSGCKSLELSMGMSDDFEVAIEEGATLVRVGTALFGERLHL